MKWGNTVRTLTLLALVPLVPCQAQEVIEGLHARGTVGFDFSGNNFSPITSVPGQSTESTPNSFFGGELGLDLSGIVMDPRFLTFSSNFNLQRGATSVNELGYSNSLLSGGADAHFLPASHFPLDVFYQRTGADTTGSIFGSNTSISQFRAQWAIDLPSVPHFVFGYSANSNNVNWADSVSNAGYKQSEWSARANDRNAGWYWNTGFDLGRLDETSLGGISFTGGGVKEDYWTLDGRAYRRFWGDKATWSNDVRDLHYSYDFAGSGTSLSNNLLLSSSLQILHTPKLSSHYSYSLSHLAQSNNFTEQPGGITILIPPTLDTQAVDAGVSYQLTSAIRVFQDGQYDHLSPLLPGQESETSLFQSSSGVSVIKRWRGFDLSTTYTGVLQRLGTNFDNQGNGWSNNVDARVGWGDAKRVRLTGNYRYERLNLVQEIGGFSHFNTFGGQAETSRFWGVRLSGGVDHGRIDLLGISGETRRDYTTYSAQVEHRRFHLSASRGLNDGSGLVFPTNNIGQTDFFVPLPVSQLIATPLLDLTSRSTNLSGLVRVRRNLEIDADFRKENDLLFSSVQQYRLWEIRARYNIGRITIDAGVGDLRSEISQSDNLSGLGVNRYWFRIRRSFKLF